MVFLKDIKYGVIHTSWECLRKVDLSQDGTFPRIMFLAEEAGSWIPDPVIEFADF